MLRGVLVVDDDEDDCAFVKESLIQIGIRLPINFVLGGLDALGYLKACGENLPALIILDLNMPDMNGFEVLERINDEFGIPVIMYTTTCTEETQRRARELGAIDCIKKGTSYADNLKFAKYIFDVLKKF
jgi:CheY-like chemotaxis protein